MSTKRKTAEAQAAAPETQTAAAEAQGRQPGEDPAEPKRSFGPDPFPIDTDTKAGARLLAGGRHYDKDLGRYAFRNVLIQFDQKPGQLVLDKVSQAGFSWDRKHQAWTKKVAVDSPVQSRLAAEELFREVTATLREEKGLGSEKAPS